MTCVQSSSSDRWCSSLPRTATGETKRTPANDGNTVGLMAAKRFLCRYVGRGRSFKLSISDLAAMTGIKERTLEGMRAEQEPQNISIDQAGRIALALDRVDRGLGALFLSAAFGGYGYAAHPAGDGKSDPIGSAALASGYAAEVCKALSPGGPGGAATTPAEAASVIDWLDRAVAAMLEARPAFVRRRGS